MTRAELKNIKRYMRNGKLYTYFRPTGQRIIGEARLDPVSGDLLPSAEWLAHYNVLSNRNEAEGPSPSLAGSFRRLVEEFYDSPEFTQLAEGSRKDYARYLDELCEKCGDLAVKSLDRPAVIRIRDYYGSTPRKSKYMVQLIRRLMTFAIDRGYRQDNPAMRIKALKQGDGHSPWEEWQIHAFRQTWPLGTWERTAFELLLNTGQRGQDVREMTRNHITSYGTIRVKQQKTGDRVEVPISNDLRAALDAWLPEIKALALLPNRDGAPYRASPFSARVREAFREAGLVNITIHGGRYTAATVLRELGADPDVIAAITSHRTEAMVRKYTQKRRRAEIGVAAMNRGRK